MIPFPNKKYDVIYADPPWNIGTIELDKWKSPLSDKYPTMSDDELINLPIKEISNEDCALFMWTTHSMIPTALVLMEKWGFKYYCIITWDKGSGWCQHGFNKRTELLLFGYKGKITKVIKQEGKFFPTIITENKTTHSRKPHRVYAIIENSTTGQRIELFARNKRQGWDTWGNEIIKEEQTLIFSKKEQ